MSEKNVLSYFMPKYDQRFIVFTVQSYIHEISISCGKKKL